jgi:hypothetical protein
MSLRIPAVLLLLTGCTPDPAELTVSLAEPATATAQYFHGNCLAGFSVGVDLRVQETRRIGVLLSRLSYRVTDRGTGLVLVDESLDTRGMDERYGAGASSIPAGSTGVFRIGSVSNAPVGPIAVAGGIEGLDENDQTVVESFDLSAPLVVIDPGPPSGGACTPP